MRLITVLIIAFIPIQFIGDKIKNPPVKEVIEAPKEVKQILERSCYPCHSNKTQFQWYDKIAPGSWLVNSHFKTARNRYNLT
ncbi:MAG: heme-binding domain-containing protein [Flavobacterium sp.]|nr:heme-binding domain-containing protein [Flavobacterium sp.]